MCETCGCGDPHVVSVEIRERILSVNDRDAAHNREHFTSHGVLAINLMGSPGSGKTAVLEATARAFAGRFRVAAIAGDLETERDAERLRRAGIPARAITTGSACHLDADMVHHALHDDSLHDARLLFVENVGNLVCPAVYDLGQAFNVVALAVTEGEDKPLKYPVMFRKADLVLITKTDLLPYLDVQPRHDRRGARQSDAGAAVPPGVGPQRRRDGPLVRLARNAAGGAKRPPAGPRRRRPHHRHA